MKKQLHIFTKYLLAVLFLLTAFLSYSQSEITEFKTLTIEEGLSHNKTNCIHEDSLGFIWIGTFEGLNRFDGYDFQWFTKEQSKLIKNRVDDIKEDNKGYLWVINNQESKIGITISLVHIIDLKVVDFESRFGSDLPFDKNEILKVIQSKNKEIIVYTKKGQSFLLKGNEKWEQIQFKNKFVPHIWGSENACWGKLATSLVKMNQAGEILESIPLPDEYSKLDVFIEDAQKRPWFLLNHKHSKEKNKLAPKFYIGAQPSKIIDLLDKNALRRTNVIEHQGKVWIVNFKKILKINPNDFTVEKELNKVGLFSDYGANNLLIQNNTLWLTMSVGVMCIQQNENPFQQILKLETGKKYNSRGLNKVGDYLFVSNNKQTGKFHLKDKIFTPFPSNTNTSNILSFPLPSSKKNDILLITDNVIFANPYTGKVLKTYIQPQLNADKTIRLTSALQDSNGIWWFGNMKNLFYLDENKHDTLQVFSQLNGFDDFKSSKKWHIVENGKDKWIATENGLFRLEKGKGIIEQYHSSGQGKYYLPSNQFQYIYIDKNGLFYLCSNNSGLIIWNPETSEIQQVNRTSGLLNNDVYAVFEDEFGYLWLSTQLGLAQVNKQTLHVRMFMPSDGINHREFNKKSHFKDKDGTIYLGGLNGVIAFHPKNFRDANQYNADLKVARVTVLEEGASQITDITSDFYNKSQLTLKPNQQYIALKLSLIDYLYSDKAIYSYKIEGSNENWTRLSSNILQISGLSYGSYQLKIRAQGGNQQFSNKVLTIPLTIKRPFYLTWWFILLVVGVLSMSILQYSYWQLRRLKERQIQLENMVSIRTQQIEEDKAIIEEQAEQLKELDEIKSRFFANISHELRTPLTLILGPLDSVLNSDELTNRNFTALQLMKQNGKKLLKRINELLDLSRLDADKLEVQEMPTFLYNYLKRLLSSFEGATNLNNIQLNFDYQLDTDLQLLLDTDKVEKILANYLSNAVKFTPKNGTIQLKVLRKTNFLEFCVKDTGIGILPEELSKIFDRFYQTKNNRQQGSGIGLSLCKELAKLLGGTVWATSEIGKGSQFFVKIPFKETFVKAKNDKIEEVEKEVIRPQIKKQEMEKTPFFDVRPIILIVEDNVDLRKYIKYILEKEYQIIMTENGKEALQYLSSDNQILSLPQQNDENPSVIKPNRRQISLIISDIMMPIMDGIELLKKVKSDDNFRHIPMIMLTARQSMEIKLEALRIGVDDYLTKPFKEAELKARVSNLIEISQNRISSNAPTNVPNLTNVSNADLSWLKEIEALMVENIGNSKFKMTDVAMNMALSPRRFQQKIKAITGLTPKQYQREIRLDYARTLLKSGNVQTVSEVSYKLGFEDAHYFSKLYKKQFGVMPSEEL